MHICRFKTSWALFVAIVLMAAGRPIIAQAVEGNVVYYNQGAGAAAETSFPFQVLRLALSKCGKTYQLKPSPIGKADSDRAASAMQADGPIDVQWIPERLSDDAKMLPVLFPVDRGLLGYRLFLIDGARQGEFDQIKSLTDLKAKVALQGAGWADVAILRSADLQVRTAPLYPDLFRMTVGGRADYFPRGAFEAYNEVAQWGPATPGLAVEQGLILHYPLATIFYVKKTDKVLADDLLRGLVTAFNDGSYTALFSNNADVKMVVDHAHMKSRRTIEIDNPFMSPAMKATDSRYWYRP